MPKRAKRFVHSEECINVYNITTQNSNFSVRERSFITSNVFPRCPDCGKRFAKSHHLKAHLNTHYRGGSSASHNTSTTNNNSNHLKSCSDPAGPPADNVVPMEEDDADNNDDDDEDASSDGGVVVNPFGQLVNIGDYMIAKAASEDAGGGVGGATDVGDDPLLNVVTVLAANQVAGLVEGDYANIRIISG